MILKDLIKLSDILSEKINTKELLLIRGGYDNEEQQDCETSTCITSGCVSGAAESSSCKDYSCESYS